MIIGIYTQIVGGPQQALNFVAMGRIAILSEVITPAGLKCTMPFFSGKTTIGPTSVPTEPPIQRASFRFESFAGVLEYSEVHRVRSGSSVKFIIGQVG